MKPLYEETQNLMERVVPAVGSKVGDLYFLSQVIQFTEKISIEFCKWRRHREFEINTLEQRHHSDTELFHLFKQEYENR